MPITVEEEAKMIAEHKPIFGWVDNGDGWLRAPNPTPTEIEFVKRWRDERDAQSDGEIKKGGIVGNLVKLVVEEILR